jgi:hypothetical protein
MKLWKRRPKPVSEEFSWVIPGDLEEWLYLTERDANKDRERRGLTHLPFAVRKELK